MRIYVNRLAAAMLFSCTVFGFVSESESCIACYPVSEQDHGCGLDKTILECASKQIPGLTFNNGFNFDSGSDKTLICHGLSKEARTNILRKITDGIHASLTYLKNHLDSFSEISTALALSMVKGIDDAHRGEFEQQFQLSDMALRICRGLNKTEDAKYCELGLQKADWQRVRGKSVISASVINELRKPLGYEHLGNEKETIVPDVMFDCQDQLAVKCEQTSTCKEIFFATEPTSQYMLTHQLLHRMMTDTIDCKSLRYLKDENVEHGLCAKMYMEAQLISSLKYPVSLGDLFLEHVGFCGYKGYENFFRIDWLEDFLPWQNKLGCFVSPSRLTTDTDEECDKHLTAVGLLSLSVFYDHLNKECK